MQFLSLFHVLALSGLGSGEYCNVFVVAISLAWAVWACPWGVLYWSFCCYFSGLRCLGLALGSIAMQFLSLFHVLALFGLGSGEY